MMIDEPSITMSKSPSSNDSVQTMKIAATPPAAVERLTWEVFT
jgi:hypothetical protein